LRDLAGRIRTAFDRFNAGKPTGARLTQTRLGEMVADAVGEPEPYGQSAVSSWMSDKKPSDPGRRAVGALASILGADRDWLAFGSEPS
jgi:hypothetical protein